MFDFLSERAKGRPARASNQEAIRLWDGISVYSTEAQARRKARGLPVLGAFIAAIHIPVSAHVRFERTTRSDGHYTIWGDAPTLLSYVRAVSPV